MLHELNPLYIVLGALIFFVFQLLGVCLVYPWWDSKHPSAFDLVFRAYTKQYAIDSPEKRQAMADTIASINWEALKAAHSYTCLCCHRKEPEITLTRDHVLAITKGGTDDIGNIQPLCLSCNAKKQTEFVDYRQLT